MKKLDKEIITSEHEIALIQLEKLKEISRNRLLTPDEVKMYDLLVKNLRLIQDKSTDVITASYSKLDSKQKAHELIEIASGLKVIGNESDETDKK